MSLSRSCLLIILALARAIAPTELAPTLLAAGAEVAVAGALRSTTTGLEPFDPVPVDTSHLLLRFFRRASVNKTPFYSKKLYKLVRPVLKTTCVIRPPLYKGHNF